MKKREKKLGLHRETVLALDEPASHAALPSLRAFADAAKTSGTKVAAPATARFVWDEGARPNFYKWAGLPTVPLRTDSPFGAIVPANP